MKKVWMLLVALALAAASVLPLGAARAQSVVRFSALEVDLWPEYDQAAMLVMYRITLAADVALPAQISLRLPLAVGEPNAVAVLDTQGSLMSVDYDLTPSVTWETLSFQATSRNVQVEYYDESLLRDGQKRTFRYEWPGDVAVDSAQVQVQQPHDASNVQVLPGPVSSNISSDGLTYWIKDIGKLEAGQSFSIDLSYNKASDSLTQELLPVQPTGPLPTETAVTSGAFDLQTLTLWLLGGVGLALIAGGIFWYWQSGRQGTDAPNRGRARPRRKDADSAADAAAAAGVYCQQCGRRGAAGDRFCRSCGTRLRTE